MQSALVVGGDGLIARALTVKLAECGWSVIRTSRRECIPAGCVQFDLKDGVTALTDAALRKITTVFICAAVTGFAACADDPEGSRYVNVTRTVELGRFFMARGARVVYLSSNAVFDGMHRAPDERATTSPITEYGRQKADCEVGLLSAAAEFSGTCAVVRRTKVVDSSQALYCGWVQSFKSQVPAKAAADLTMCPVTATFVAGGLRSIGAGKQSGVYHISGEHDMTYFELATAMANELGRHATVEQDWVQQRLGAVPSPKYCAMSMTDTTEVWGLLPQSVGEVAKELTGRKT